MDNNEATSTVLSRIKRIDPENGSKIMGFLLLKDPGEKEMIRLAFGPENHLISLINQVKSEMGAAAASSNTCSTSPFIPIINPNRPNPFPQSSPRIIVPNNGFHISPSSPSSPWFHSPKQAPPSASSLSYAAVVNGNASPNPFASPSNPSFVSPFYQNGDDEVLFLEDGQNLDLNDPIVSPGARSDSMMFPYGNCSENHPQFLHRRSVSVNDCFLGQSDENTSNALGGGFGWKPCMYFAKGFCKNGGGCKFVHGGFAADSPDGSPKFDGFDELMRMKAIQHQRMALAAGPPMPYNNRCMSFLNDSPRSAAAAAVMMGDDYLPFGRCRHDRSDFAGFGFREHPNSSSRQIYLTFPADSTFKEEDVSNYFSSFGPVQDVRIPYQQKRMFGFVTFVYPETVKQILAKGNPHFVCDSRVLVKPYKEKGKLPDKKHHMEMGDFPACFSPSGPDSMEPFDLPFGRRVMYTQEMMLRRKLEEQAELQQAIEYQGRRLMNLQLPEMMNQNLNHQLHRHMAVMPVPFPPQAYSQINQGLAHSSDGITQDDDGGNTGKDEAVSPTIAADQQDNESNVSNGYGSDNDKQKVPSLDESDPHDPHASILEHILPDSLFASPKKADQSLVPSAAEMDDTVPVTSTLMSPNLYPAVTSSRSIASLSSRFSEMPRKPLV